MPLSPARGTIIANNDHNSSSLNIKEKYLLDCDYIFYPAQFWAHKNHVYLLHGLKILEQEFGYRIGAIFAGGDQGNLAYIHSIANLLGLSNRVRFAGFVPNEEIPYLYKQSLALVMPTYFGPTNLPPLEAFTLGVPVLYPNKVGLRDQVGSSALLMVLSDPRSMAAHLCALIEDPMLRNKLIAAGHDLVLHNKDTNRLATLIDILLFQDKTYLLAVEVIDTALKLSA